MLEERRRILALEHFGFDPVEIDAHLVGDAAVGQRFDQRLVGVLETGILADDGDRHLAFGIADALVDHAPAVEIGLALRLDFEGRQHFAVKPGS